MRKGLDYQFSLKDLTKYSKNLHKRDLRNRFHSSVLGKYVPTLAERMRQLEQIQKKLKEETYWEYLRNQALLAQQDWSKTTLFEQYLKSGFFKEHNPNIYSETEVQYYITVIKKTTQKKYDDITKDEISKLTNQHYSKALHTLKVLMKTLCLEYYFERVLLRYPIENIENVMKILVRCKKMYEAIDNVFIIFKLSLKVEVSKFYLKDDVIEAIRQ